MNTGATMTDTQAATAAEDAALAQAAATLSQACTALWTATLSLMTAFMHQPAPAHRYLMARKIAANFALLQDQPCFTHKARESFARLATHWGKKADRLSPKQDKPSGGFGALRPAWLSGLF
ncbi:hypothetical protein [Caenimonas aquaedulcis]|uniref:Uncharacterized protein n=1 Tax=Caenimonas aquaedulcis TaxID=2793270 RepID=A0A931H3J2_9BURK|nr:hypothetical protein [Caenimonas aquaedulcis]MBG9387954.1 hypothetical protein [Caenimonas aquaedulcis]